MTCRAHLVACAIAIAVAACAPARASPPIVEMRALAHPPAPAFALALDGVPTQGGLLFGTATGTASLMLDGKTVAVAADGRFLIGLDRDHGPSALLAAYAADGRVLTRRLAVVQREWKIEHVGIARRPPGPSADFLGIRERELARISAARARASESGGWRQAFIWPARGRISGVFGSQRIYRGGPGSFHNGIDLAAGAEAAVVAPADGIVLLAGPPAFSLEGNLVVLAHGMGLTSAFLHLSETLVREGQAVRQGELIGRVGATGRATGPHLHWGVRWGEARIDPQRLVAAPASP